MFVASEPGHIKPLSKLFRFESQLFLSLVISQAKLGTLMPVSLLEGSEYCIWPGREILLQEELSIKSIGSDQ